MEDQKQEVIITRTFPAGIERVWNAFTTKEDILKWQSPVGMTTPSCELDLRVGGKYSITMEYEETGEQVTVRGEFTEIKKPRKLSYTWKWDGSEEETEVHFFFKALSEDETELTLIHRGFSLQPAKVDIDNNWTHESHTAGWTTGFQKLEILLKSA
jgi:uncharacterized protein YndB with AHSA1/START domain